MRIKKFIASNMQEGKQLIERELGVEAIILSNRKTKTKSGIDAIELVAALDNDNKITGNKTANPFAKSKLLNSIVNPDNVNSEINKKLIAEVGSLKEMLNELSDNIKYKYTGTMPETLARVYKIMRQSDINEEIALDIIGKITAKGLSNDYNQAIAEARKQILKDIKYSEPITKTDTRQIVSFVGPTGSGKTSSLIKLAIISKLLHKSKILIISTDTFKVGGAEQLQTLAGIAGINFVSVYSTDELRKILIEEKSYDLVLIDNVGRNPNNKDEMDALLELQIAAKSNQNYLVLSATTSESALKNTISKYKNFAVSSIIITKVDEAFGLGNIISAIKTNNISLGYFSYGQKIPDDIEYANSEKLNDYLFVV
jgi:flagellar biosynthesis protein FlhF